MIREITRPPTAKCTLPTYVSFLLSEPKSTSCLRLSEIDGVSHDSVNRFLNRETYEPIDLFNEVKKHIALEGGTLGVDDTVIDKPYAKYIAYIGYFWSGKHHKSVKGINLITLYYTDPQGHQQPVNYRIYDKSEGKTKNDYFAIQNLSDGRYLNGKDGLYKNRPQFVNGNPANNRELQWALTPINLI